ncbi:MAG: NfeD family protein [Leptolyngbya sp. SIO1D8]|nr:NfeD family protein [Leptolyngbya sp. SIO1D8]
MTLPNLLTLTLGPVPWLVSGLMLLGFSLLVPRPTIASFGFAGVLTALIALSIPLFASQLLIWGISSGGFILILRGLVPQESKALEPARHARVSEQIPPGGVGHVHYEGATWQARCQISDVAIAPETPVAVIDRQGNTLIVLPIPTSPSNPA